MHNNKKAMDNDMQLTDDQEKHHEHITDKRPANIKKKRISILKKVVKK